MRKETLVRTIGIIFLLSLISPITVMGDSAEMSENLNADSITDTETLDSDFAPGDEFDDGTYTYRINEDGNTLTVTGLVNATKLINNPVIPSTVSGMTVIAIGDNAFLNYRGIMTGNLTLPNSLKTIGENAFYNCEYLTGSLIIPNGVTDISSSAFSKCTGFTGDLILPDSILKVGSQAFYSCGFNGKLKLSNNMTEISGTAFGYNKFTGPLIIPNGVVSIGSYAFYCTEFTGDLIIPNSVTTINSYAIWSCPGFNGVLTISESVNYIGDNAFEGSLFKKIQSYTVQPCKASWFIGYSEDYFISETGEKITKEGVLRKGTFTKHVGVTNVVLNETYVTIKTGKTVTLTATVEPSTASNKNISWKSSDNKIATVTNGVVKGISGGTATITVTTEDGQKTASCEITVEEPAPKPSPDPTPTPEKTSIQNAKVKLSKTSYTYDKKTHIPNILTIGGYNLNEETDYTASIINSNGKITSSPKSAGTYIIVITGKGDYTGMTSTKFIINKAQNPMKVKGKDVSIRYSKLKKKPQTIKRSKIFSVSKNQGKVTYKKTKGNAKISIEEKKGNLTVKKGLKKGSYTVKVKVTAAGNKNYKVATKTVKFTVTVK